MIEMAGGAAARATNHSWHYKALRRAPTLEPELGGDEDDNSEAFGTNAVLHLQELQTTLCRRESWEIRPSSWILSWNMFVETSHDLALTKSFAVLF